MQAAKILFNHFVIPFDETLKLIRTSPPQYLEMIWPTIDLRNEIVSRLLHYFKTEGKEQINRLSKSLVIANKVNIKNTSYKLTKEGLSIMGDFELFVKKTDDQTLKRESISKIEFCGEFDLDINESKDVLIQSADLDKYY